MCLFNTIQAKKMLIWIIFKCKLNTSQSLGGVVGEHPPWVHMVASLIVGRVILKTFKMVVMTALLRVVELALQLTGWCQDKWNISTVESGKTPIKEKKKLQVK